jgi:hypothetical protein
MKDGLQSVLITPIAVKTYLLNYATHTAIGEIKVLCAAFFQESAFPKVKKCSQNIL